MCEAPTLLDNASFTAPVYSYEKSSGSYRKFFRVFGTISRGELTDLASQER